MTWSTILNHDTHITRFQRGVDRNRLASTYLFVGPPGIGKRTFALKLAEVLLCENPPDAFDCCGTCPACQQVQAGTHPDLILVSKPEDKAFIPVETFIGDKEHRRQAGLCHDLGLKPFRGGHKIAIVTDADYLNQEGANSLLKTLEEPPPHSLLILIGSSEQQQLSTIVSRSQVVRFAPLGAEQVATILGRQADLETTIPLEQLAAAAGGSLKVARQLADPDTFEFRKSLFQQLATLDPGRDDFSKTVIGFVDAAGKDAAKKRERLRVVANFAIDFFRKLYRQVTGVDPTLLVNDLPDNQAAIETVAKRLEHHTINEAAEIAGRAIERCIELQTQIAANVNPSNAVEGWLIDLGKVCRRQPLYIPQV